ncbi:transposase [Candidatus Daviesbacteria bacterium]|nr:transposase [Candidatus Daviesbacteria bacterium]
MDDSDYHRLLEVLYYYQFSGPKPRFSTHKYFRNQTFNKNPKIVEIISYCLMPNHFHLLLKQLKDGGIQEFIRKISNSYTKYFNTKHKRVGPLFQGNFKAKDIETDEQLVHVSRYIHLNPFVAGLTNNLENFPYSSYQEYLEPTQNKLSIPKVIMDFFKKPADYQKFIEDQKDYSKTLDQIKHLLLEE